MTQPKKTAYFVATALFCAAIAPSAVLNVVQPSFVVDAMEIIGMPMPVIAWLGVWKMLGIAALAQPRFRRLNEWAYAGFFFDLTGAAFAHAAASDTVVSMVTPLVFLLPLGVSYALRPEVEAGAAPVMTSSAG